MLSLNGEEDAPREYMMSTGMISSLYESVVWEQITGEESVSTISILAKASEENIDILLISGANLDTEIEKLNTDEATKQEVINAVNSGKIVTIPAENIIMGDWNGTGYIVMNPETGAGAYKISGGLNGGEVPVELLLKTLAATFSVMVGTASIIKAVTLTTMFLLYPVVTTIIAAAIIIPLLILIENLVFEMYASYYDYIESGDMDEYIDAEEKSQMLTFIGCLELMAAQYLLLFRAVTDDSGEIEEAERKYSEAEIKDILEDIRGDGFKNNPLRQEYEQEVRELSSYGEELMKAGYSEEETARLMNQARRDLGIKYKDMTPQPLRDYIYEINMKRYNGDKLGPTYEYLKEQGKSDVEIIISSSNPNSDIDKLLSGFEEWLRSQ